MTLRTPLLFLALLATAMTGCFTVTSVEPAQLSLYAHTPVEIHGTGFATLAADSTEVYVGGRRCVNLAIVSDDALTCLPQGQPQPGLADIEVRDTSLLGTSAMLADAIEYVETAYPKFRNVWNFGPSLSAGMADMAYEPRGQINSVPGFLSRQMGLYFPQRLAIESGLPNLDAPNQVSHVFVGDGQRECSIPGTGQTTVLAPGEICDPVLLDLIGESAPVLDILLTALPVIIDGLVSGDGLAGGFFQDPDIENHNRAVPGSQMEEFVFGISPGFAYVQDFMENPAAPIRPLSCYAEPPVKTIAEAEPAADLVIGFDWFFDSVLFGRPPQQDLMHQLLFGMLVLSTAQFHADEPCPAGTTDGTWRVPLISRDGTRTRTHQPYEGMPEECTTNFSCPDSPSAGSFVEAASVPPTEDLVEIMALIQPKEGYVVDWIALGLVDASADVNGNGFIDIDFENAAANEFTAEVLASILVTDDASDDPSAIILSTMPWPDMSATSHGGVPGGPGDVYADRINVGVRWLFELFDEASTQAGRVSNIVPVDVVALIQDMFEGNRPDLVELDGDPDTTDLIFEYQLDGQGQPIKRGFPRYGGGFSLDHLHLSQTMNGIIANEIMRVLNERRGLGIAPLDLAGVWAQDPYAVTRYDDSIRCEFQGEDSSC